LSRCEAEEFADSGPDSDGKAIGVIEARMVAEQVGEAHEDFIGEDDAYDGIAAITTGVLADALLRCVYVSGMTPERPPPVLCVDELDLPGGCRVGKRRNFEGRFHARAEYCRPCRIRHLRRHGPRNARRLAEKTGDQRTQGVDDACFGTVYHFGRQSL